MALDFTISTENPNCLDSLGGSIIIESGEDDLLFGLDRNQLTLSREFDNLSSGSYVIYAANTLGCLDSTNATITLENNFSLDLDINRFVGEASSIELNPDNTLPPETQFEWNTSDFNIDCTNCVNPTIFADRNGQVSLLATFGDCQSEAIISIRIEENNNIYVPNAVSYTHLTLPTILLV